MLPRTPSSASPAAPPARSAAAVAAAKRRGSYNCGRCGLPKRGHVCAAAPAAVPNASAAAPPSRLRRALSFDDDRASSADPLEAADEMSLVVAKVEPAEEDAMYATEDDGVAEEDVVEVEVGGGAFLPADCMVEVLRRLPPKELMGAAAVCKGWRGCVRRVWRSAEELRLQVSPRRQIGFVGSVLHKCAGLVRLALRMESDVDATLLACVAFSCPNLESFEINVADNVVNQITGAELSRFVAEKRSLSTLKVEGCSNLGFLNLSSLSLSTLWLSDLYCISKSAIKCPNLKELSLDFIRQENDTTDLTSLMESVGHTCTQLRNIHIASIQLSNEAVLALGSANLRDLRKLSLVLGSRITDAAVTAIVSSYANLELLDLSGSSITDSGIRMICHVFPETLSKLLLALCSNITSTGIQLAATQLPLLELMDCGMTIHNFTFPHEGPGEILLDNMSGTVGNTHQSLSNRKQQCGNQKLIIKHGHLRKLSLWGCSGLDALCLNCPELYDLNLNLCTNLHPERLLLRCPNLKNIHASGCQDMLIGAIRNQVLNEFAGFDNHLSSKRLADGSKRVQVPHFIQQVAEDEKQKRMKLTQCIVHHD